MLRFYPRADGPHARLEIQNGVSIELTWDNTVLYTHREKYAEVDHVFWTREQKIASAAGLYIFRQAVPNFDELAYDLLSNDFMQVHKPIPEETDVDKWVEFNTSDL